MPHEHRPHPPRRVDRAPRARVDALACVVAMTVHTVSSWRCAGPATVPPTSCEACGEGPGSDKAAERHTKATGHMTLTRITPTKEAGR